MFEAPDGMEGVVRGVQLDPAGVLGDGQAGASQLRAVFLGGFQELVGFSRRVLLETAFPDGGPGAVYGCRGIDLTLRGGNVDRRDLTPSPSATARITRQSFGISKGLS